MNAWTKTGCISFVETGGTGDVRISRAASGYWSYLGTDIRLIPKNRPTMNLQAFSMSTPESEYKRVVRHETGHTLGFPHEHMRQGLIARIDPNKAYAYFLSTQGWDKAMVDAQVLTPLSQQSLMGTPEDQTSIMCYQLPASITKDGKPIIGGIDINATDYSFAGRIYPKRSSAEAASPDPGRRGEATAKSGTSRRTSREGERRAGRSAIPGAPEASPMSRLIEIQAESFPSPLTVRVGDVLLFQASGVGSRRRPLNCGGLSSRPWSVRTGM